MNKTNSFLINGSCFVVLAALLCLGFALAHHHPMWNDEINSFVYSIHDIPYTAILNGKITEGNNAPLFYLIQKVLCDIVRYNIPHPWTYHDWSYKDIHAQVFLRIQPVIFMSIALLLMFRYFLRHYGWLTAGYSLMVAVSSFMVWAYYVESRPYALWFLLTTIQAFLLLRLFEDKKPSIKFWRSLTVVHILMSFTVFLSVIQITVASALLWLWCEKDVRKYILPTAVPLLIAMYYHCRASHFGFWFFDSPLQLIKANIPLDRMLILGVFGLLLLGCAAPWQRIFKNFYRCEPMAAIKGYFTFTILMVLAGAAMLFLMAATENHNGFQVSNRYLIQLTPIGIIAIVLCSVHMLRAFASRRLVWLVLIVGLGGLLMFRCLRTYQLVESFYHFNAL